MDFVSGVGIPDDELAILRGGDEMSSVLGPVHGVDFGKMTTESTARLHDDTR